MSEPWIAEFVGGPCDSEWRAMEVGVHTLHIPMLVPGVPGISRGSYVRTDERSGDGLRVRMRWTGG